MAATPVPQTQEAALHTPSRRAACIGECMIELLETAPGVMRRSWSGDVCNTAVYLARSLGGSGIGVDLVTALGDDPYSEEMLTGWRAAGLGTGLVQQLAGRLPGLYTIQVDESGERHFHYWRSAAAARELLRAPGAGDRLVALAGYALVYLSGITLAILDADSRARLLGLLERARGNGGRIAFDGNFRPRLWDDDGEARAWVDRTLALTDTALMTFDDERALYGDPTADATVARLAGHGIGEIVVKQGAEPCLVATPQGRDRVAPPPVAPIVDTTAAGDAFNGGYLAARLKGQPPAEAAAAGHALAGTVIQHRGAIVPE